MLPALAEAGKNTGIAAGKFRRGTCIFALSDDSPRAARPPIHLGGAGVIAPSSHTVPGGGPQDPPDAVKAHGRGDWLDSLPGVEPHDFACVNEAGRAKVSLDLDDVPQPND